MFGIHTELNLTLYELYLLYVYRSGKNSLLNIVRETLKRIKKFLYVLVIAVLQSDKTAVLCSASVKIHPTFNPIQMVSYYRRLYRYGFSFQENIFLLFYKRFCIGVKRSVNEARY